MAINRPIYTHLRVQSSYSLLSSTLKMENICQLAVDNFMPAIALTDHNNLFGSLEFSLVARKKKILPIQGTILTIKYKYQDQQYQANILLLVKSEIGYKNLIKLVTGIYCNDMDIALDIEYLQEHSMGLICLSGYTEGPIGMALYDNDLKRAEYLTKKLYQIFNDNFYFEIMRHGLEIEKKIESYYVYLASKNNIPLVATNKVLFALPDGFEAHDTLLCISNGNRKTDIQRPISNKNYYFKSITEMHELFSDIPSAITNAQYIVQRCGFFVEKHSPILPSFCAEGQEAEKQLLKKEAQLGLAKYLSKLLDKNLIAQYQKRLDYELDVICKMNFAGYFLIVSDFVKWSKKQSIPVGPGRGSGAGSIVAWSLQITNLDPIEYDLIFERFLNPERVSMPDFDIDFCQERRPEVINYIREKYGNDRVAQIITFGTLQPKAAIKDISRVLELPFYYANYISNLIPFNAVQPISLTVALKEVLELQNIYKGQGIYSKELIDSLNSEELEDLNKKMQQVLEIAKELEGLHRHISIHAAGIIICRDPLIEHVALYKDSYDNKMYISQYSLKYAEIAGLVKFDFLGLKTLTVIDKTISMIRNNKDIDIDTIPLDDDATFKILQQGKSIGVFQFDSKGLQDELKRFYPKTIFDLMDLTSLYRPGPIGHIPNYLACKEGMKEPDYMHDLLEPILKTTYGVIIYQEQVLKIAQVLSGYSLAASDLLRRAMGKKNVAEMKKHKKIFIAGAEKNSIDKDVAVRIFDSITPFAGYGFNRAHAASYTLISYQTAYLKANYLIEFLAISMNLEMSDHFKLSHFITDTKRSGIKIIKPCINLSNSLFHPINDDSIVYGLGAIKAVAVNIGNKIEAERRDNGKFINIRNFIKRTKNFINKRAIEALIKGGVLDILHDNRKELFDSVEIILNNINIQKNTSSQLSLISDEDEVDDIIIKHNEFWNSEQQAYNEFQVLGVFLTCHPLDAYIDYIRDSQIYTSYEVREELSTQGKYRINMIGVIEYKIIRIGSKGKQFTILQLSDHEGHYDATIFDTNIQKQYSDLLKEKSQVILILDLINTGTTKTLHIVEVAPINTLIKKTINNINIRIDSIEILHELKSFLINRIDASGITVHCFFVYQECFVIKTELPYRYRFGIYDIDYLSKWFYKPKQF